MLINKSAYLEIRGMAEEKNAVLVAVSKTKSAEAILELYNLGQRDFGENYVQEMVEKQKKLPADIRWHFIGHLQTNKVKMIAPFVHLIHGVESYRLVTEINRQAQKNNRILDMLLQVFIASEESKFGLDEMEVKDIMQETDGHSLPNVRICGLMGMASFTSNLEQVRKEFKALKNIYNRYKQFSVLSMGMSSDYKVALEAGSTMIRIGSLIFGERT